MASTKSGNKKDNLEFVFHRTSPMQIFCMRTADKILTDGEIVVLTQKNNGPTTIEVVSAPSFVILCRTGEERIVYSRQTRKQLLSNQKFLEAFESVENKQWCEYKPSSYIKSWVFLFLQNILIMYDLILYNNVACQCSTVGSAADS